MPAPTTGWVVTKVRKRDIEVSPSARVAAGPARVAEVDAGLERPDDERGGEANGEDRPRGPERSRHEDDDREQREGLGREHAEEPAPDPLGRPEAPPHEETREDDREDPPGEVDREDVAVPPEERQGDDERGDHPDRQEEPERAPAEPDSRAIGASSQATR